MPRALDCLSVALSAHLAQRLCLSVLPTVPICLCMSFPETCLSVSPFQRFCLSCEESLSVALSCPETLSVQPIHSPSLPVCASQSPGLCVCHAHRLYLSCCLQVLPRVFVCLIIQSLVGLAQSPCLSVTIFPRGTVCLCVLARGHFFYHSIVPKTLSVCLSCPEATSASVFISHKGFFLCVLPRALVRLSG